MRYDELLIGATLIGGIAFILFYLLIRVAETKIEKLATFIASIFALYVCIQSIQAWIFWNY